MLIYKHEGANMDARKIMKGTRRQKEKMVKHV